MMHIAQIQAVDENTTKAPTRRALAKQQTRAKVLAAARRLFSEQGYEGATIRDIAAAAGMSTGAVFANFADKSDLFREIMMNDTLALAESMREAASAASGVDDALLRMFVAGYSFYQTQLPLARAAFSVGWSPQDGPALRNSAPVQALRGLIAEQLTRGIERAELAQDLQASLRARNAVRSLSVELPAGDLRAVESRRPSGSRPRPDRHFAGWCTEELGLRRRLIIHDLAERHLTPRHPGGRGRAEVARPPAAADCAPSTRQTQKEATRNRVIEAARDLFDTQGYHGTTIREIARHAGVSVGSVFTTFASKYDILSQVMQDRLDGLYAELDRVMPHLRGETLDRLRTMFAIHFAFEVRHKRLFLAYISATYDWTLPSASTPMGRNRRLQDIICECWPRASRRATSIRTSTSQEIVDLLMAAYIWVYRLAAWHDADAPAMTEIMDRQLGLIAAGFAPR